MLTCAHCGNEFEPNLGRGRPRKYCGDRCGNAAGWERRKAKGPIVRRYPNREVACATCGTTCWRTKTSAQAPRCLSCSKDARKARKEERLRQLQQEIQARRETREREMQNRSPRPSPRVRGYGHEHRMIRQAWEPIVATGEVECWRCDQLIKQGEPWDLGHDDVDRTLYRGPEHRRCNRAVKGREPNAPATARYAPRGRTMTERTCEVCCSTYRPSYSGQRTCGRKCGAVLNVQARARTRQPKRAAAPRVKVCDLCGSTHTTRRRRYCTEACMVEANARINRDRYRRSAGLLVEPDAPTGPRTDRPVLKVESPHHPSSEAFSLRGAA